MKPKLKNKGNNSIGYEVEGGRKNKFLLQRINRGYDDSIFWNLDEDLVTIIHDFYVCHSIGCPLEYENKEEEWEKIKEKIIFGCRLYRTSDMMNKEQMKIWNDTKKLIMDHWECMWN